MGEGAENEVSITGEKLDVDVVFESSIPETTSAPYCWYDPMTLLFSEVCLYASVCVCMHTLECAHVYRCTCIWRPENISRVIVRNAVHLL